MKRSPEAFKRGDRVKLMLRYDFWGNPPPKGTVVGTSSVMLVARWIATVR
jgi:hypothetical protein